MPVNYFVHTLLSDNTNELRACVRVARLLTQPYSDSPHPYTLIGNIQPDKDPNLTGLPQLDLFLLGPNFAAILEFKNYYDPIQARHLDGKWEAIGRKNRQTVLGGSQRNPYLQARHARKKWLIFLKEFIGQYLSVFVLFHPYLHPDSNLPPLGPDSYWFHIRSIDEILDLVYTTRSPAVTWTLAEQQTVAQNVFRAKPWPELYALLPETICYLYVLEPDQPPIRYPIQPFDDFVIGRSVRQKPRVRLHSDLVSSAHAQIYVQHTTVILQDLDSKNGTFVEGKAISDPTILESNQVVSLGGNSIDVPRFWLEPLFSEYATYDTLETK